MPLSFAVIGAGRVGTALAVLLRRAGHRVLAAWGREASRARVLHWLPGVPFLDTDPSRAIADATVVLLCVPDDAIAAAAQAIAPGVGRGHVVIHVSGSRGLDVLEAVRDRGAAAMSLHPLQSFPDVTTGVANLPGSGVAVTAADEATATLGERLARDVGGVPFRVDGSAKALYHTAAVFASNYLVTVEATAERLFRAAGIEDPVPLFEPLARANLEAAFAAGPGAALTGPAVRGDAGTIRRNAEALQREEPDALSAYVALARLAAAIASAAGRLSEKGRRVVDEELDQWG